MPDLSDYNAEEPFLVEWPLSSEAARDQLRQVRITLDRYRAALRLARQEIEDRNKIIRALTAFTYQAGRANEQTALLKVTLRHALHITQTEVGAIVLIDDTTKRLSLATAKNLTPNLAEILTGHYFDVGAAVLMPHLVAGRGVLLEQDNATETEEKVLLNTAQLKSLVSIPLEADNQLLGALIVGSQEKTVFSPTDLYFLIVLSQASTTVLQSLYVRERLWHVAESLLGDQTESELKMANSMNPKVESKPHSALQTKLNEVIKEVGGTMGALFMINHTQQEIQGMLVAHYGLSPAFTGLFVQFSLSAKLLPFELLSQPKFLVTNLNKQNLNESILLLTSLQEEGATTMMGGRVKATSEAVWIILVAATEIGIFHATKLKKLLLSTRSLARLLQSHVPETATSLPNIPAPTITTKANKQDTEKLLAAMMEAEDEVQRQNVDLMTMNTISETISRTLNLDLILNQVIKQTRHALKTEAAWIYLVDTQNQKLSLRVHEGLSDRYIRGRRYLSQGKSFEEQVAQDNQPSFIDSVTDYPVRCHILVEQEGIEAIALIPLACPEVEDDHETHRIVGVLGVGFHQSHTWRTREIRLLTAIGNQVAMAVNNAQLYTKVKEEMAMLASSNEVLQTVNSQLIADQAKLETELIQLRRKRR